MTVGLDTYLKAVRQVFELEDTIDSQLITSADLKKIRSEVSKRCDQILSCLPEQAASKWKNKLRYRIYMYLRDEHGFCNFMKNCPQRNTRASFVPGILDAIPRFDIDILEFMHGS